MIWEQMDEAAALTRSDPYIIAASVDSWIDALRTYSSEQGQELTQVCDSPLSSSYNYFSLALYLSASFLPTQMLRGLVA